MPVVKMPDGALVDMPDNPTPEQLSALQKVVAPQKADPLEDLAHKGKLTLSALARGAASLPALYSDLFAPVDVPSTKSARDLPRSNAVSNFGEHPRTVGEKYLNSGLEGVGGSFIGPGSLTKPVQTALIGLSSGLGSEAAAQTMGDNAVSRVVGAMVGGAVPTAVSALKPNAQRLLKQATEQVPEAAWRRAGRAKETLDQAGIPHLNSQLLGEGSTLPDLVAVASQHPSVRPGLVSKVEKSPELARNAYERWKSSNLPIGLDETRSVLNDVQGAAQGRINDLKAGARGDYSAALKPGLSAETYTPQQVRQLAETLRKTAADPSKFGPLTAGGQFIGKLADDIESTVKAGAILGPNGLPLERGVQKGYINNLLKDLNTRAEKEGYKGLSMDEVKAAIRQATPEFQPARDAMSSTIASTVNPAKKSLLGQLADQGGGIRPDKATATTRSLDIVFPKDVRQPDAILELGHQLGGDRVGELLREHLSRSMEQSVKLSAEAGRMQQPFDFVKAIAGTNAQRQNLEAALKVTSEAMGANPAAVRNGFYKLMRAFETTKDLKLPASVDRAVLQQQAGLNAPGLLVAPQSRLGRVLWEKATEKTFKEIAAIVTSPDGLKQLEAIAKAPGYFPASAYARSILSSTMASQNPEETP